MWFAMGEQEDPVALRFPHRRQGMCSALLHSHVFLLGLCSDALTAAPPRSVSDNPLTHWHAARSPPGSLAADVGWGDPIAELADQRGVGRHLLPFEHEILHDHLPSRGTLRRAPPHARCLRRDVDRALEGHTPSLLQALGAQIGMLQFQRGMRCKVVFEPRHEQRDRPRGRLLVLELARHVGRPQPV